jgi:hypothetical protein
MNIVGDQMRVSKSPTLRLAIAIALAGAAVAAPKASEMYFDFNRNTVGGTANASVFLFGGAGQQATVSNLIGFNQVVTLGADGFLNLSIGNSYQESGTGITGAGFKIVSPNPIAGYFVNRAPSTTDMTYLMDSGALGTQYVVASQGGGFGEGSQVMIHATQDNTTVTFTPTSGAPVTVTLNAGQTYKYAGGSANLTGSTVSADKNVAVFGGHECAQVPVGRVACDNLLEQMIPTDKLSKSYLLASSQPAAAVGVNSDLVRVIATADATEIKVNGAVVATIDKGQYFETSLTGNSGLKIDATERVMVAQYLIGQGAGATSTDPAMALVPGSDTWLKAYRLATPTGAQQFAFNYAALVVGVDDLDSLLLNGTLVDTSSFTDIAGTSYKRGIVSLPLGLFNLTADNPFLVMLGGGGSFDSYLTYGGATFAPGVSPPIEPPASSVPEPATIMLFGVGLAVASLRRGRGPRT